MAKKFRLGIIGYAHSHIFENAMRFHVLEGRVEWVAGADVKPLVEPTNDSRGTRYGLMRQLNEAIQMPKVYDDYVQMLDENEFDIMLVCAENAFHGRVCEEILRRGIHVVMEKPLATSMREAERIARAAREGNAEVILNWPSTWWPAVRKAHELCQQGAIGKLFKLTYRNSDSEGPLSYGQEVSAADKGREWWHQSAAGGGALLDYCCYGANLSRWFFGVPPVAAYGMKANFNSPYGDAEDYATITARFPEGVAILEGSWTTKNTGIPHGPILYGLEGTMVVEEQEIRIYRTRHKPDPDEIVQPGFLPEGRATLGEEVLHHFDTGEALHPTLEFGLNLDAMMILDAGIRSAESGKLELATDAIWTIG